MLRTRLLLLTWGAILALSLSGGAGLAAGDEISRADYVTRLEAACKPGSEQTRRVMKGVRLDVRRERNAVAAHKFDRSAVIFGGTVDRIGRVPRPAADLERLEGWFAHLDRQTQYMREMAAQLRADHNIRAQRLLGRFIHNGNQANNVTLGFEFEYCNFKFSRYG